MKKALLFIVSVIALLPFKSICQNNKHADLHTITIEDYQKMSDGSKAILRKDLIKAIKADTNFIVYNKLEMLQTKASINRSQQKTSTGPTLKPKGKEEWISYFKQKGITDPEGYYNRGTTANKHLFAVVKDYPILGHLNISDRTEVIKGAMVGNYNIQGIMPPMHH